MTLSFGKVFFARNNTGIKLGFTNLKKIEDSIKRLDISHIPEKFTLCNYILVNNPKVLNSKFHAKFSIKKYIVIYMIFQIILLNDYVINIEILIV